MGLYNIQPYILQELRATTNDIDQDKLNVFKLECDYIDRFIDYYEGEGAVKVDFDFDENDDICVEIKFVETPPITCKEYQLIRTLALDDSIEQISSGAYVVSFLLQSFIKS